MFEQWTLSWFAGQAGAWLLTYALHSTLLLGLAWLASRRLSKRSLQLEEAVWRCALVGSLVTATLQLAVGADPLAGRWEIAAPVAPVAVTAEVAAPRAPEAVVPALRESVPASAFRSAVPPVESTKAAPAVEPAFASRDTVSGFPVSLPLMLLGVWLAGAVLLTLGSTASYLSLFRRLRHRPRVIGGDALSTLVRLAERAGLRQPVRLTSSTRIPVPIALGVLGKAEICLPPRAFAALTTEQQEALLAHELGHIVRRDPFWLAFGRIQTGILFFQPLSWVACTRLREISELLSDEWAVGRTGRPLSLAGCLAEVAGWSLPAARPLPVPGMADRPSNLARRIGRLLEEARGSRRLHRGWLAGAAVVTLAAVVAVAPGVSAVTRAEAAPDAERVAGLSSGEEPEAAARQERDRSAAPPREQEHEHEYEHEEEYEYEHEDEEVSEAAAEAAEAAEIAREAMEDALGDLDLDLDLDLAELAGLDASLYASLGGLEELSALGAEIGMMLGNSEEIQAMAMAAQDAEHWSPEEREAFEKRAEDMARRFEETMEPQLEELEKRLDARMEAFEKQFPTAEMKRLEKEMEAYSERIEASVDGEFMKRFEADVERMAKDGLSDPERAEIQNRARELSAKVKPSEKDLAQLRALAEQHQALARKFMEDHKDEIDAMRREAQTQGEAIREQARRQMGDAQKLRQQAEEYSRERERRDPRPEPSPRPAPDPKPPVR